jgi:hypothetical protein
MATTALAKSSQMDFNNLALMCKDVVLTGTLFIGSQGISSTELGFLDGITAGTATASKALVLDSSKGIATITSATITTVVTNTITGAPTISGIVTPTGGIAAAGGFAASPRLCHTGGTAAQVSTDFTDQTPVATEVYFAEVFIPSNVTVTGVSLFRGSVTSGNIKVGLANSSGVVVATSVSTASSGTDSYLDIAFTGGTYAAVGPATYYVLAFYDNNTVRANAHTIGRFVAGKQTGQTFATGFTTITPGSSFTTALGPVATLY